MEKPIEPRLEKNPVEDLSYVTFNPNGYPDKHIYAECVDNHYAVFVARGERCLRSLTPGSSTSTFSRNCSELRGIVHSREEAERMIEQIGKSRLEPLIDEERKRIGWEAQFAGHPPYL
ncbi:MAG: hypothetical protein Q7S06_01555 [Nanoarchaeota archaeon]|nr:hypothetical protein [Nanoarchaeota archaeon]